MENIGTFLKILCSLIFEETGLVSDIYGQGGAFRKSNSFLYLLKTKKKLNVF